MSERLVVQAPPVYFQAQRPQLQRVVGAARRPSLYSAVQQPVDVEAIEPKGKKWPVFSGIAAAVVGGVQITVAVSSLLMNGVNYVSTSIPFHATPTLWCAIFLLISGGFAIAAAKHKTTCLIITNLIISIITSILCVMMAGFAAAVVAVLTVSKGPDFSDGFFSNQIYELLAGTDVRLAVSLSLIVLGCIGFVSAVVASALSCAAVCCGKSKRERPPPWRTEYYARPSAPVRLQELPPY